MSICCTGRCQIWLYLAARLIHLAEILCYHQSEMNLCHLDNQCAFVYRWRCCFRADSVLSTTNFCYKPHNCPSINSEQCMFQHCVKRLTYLSTLYLSCFVLDQFQLELQQIEARYTYPGEQCVVTPRKIAAYCTLESSPYRHRAYNSNYLETIHVCSANSFVIILESINKAICLLVRAKLAVVLYFVVKLLGS